MAATNSRFQRRRTFFKRLRLYGYVSGGVLFAVLLVYLFAASPLFKIGALTIVGGESIDQEKLIALLKTEVVSQPLGWLGADNYLAWPTDLEYAAPQIAGLAIDKSFWSRGITITVTPRQRYAVWCNEGSDCDWIDESGIIFEPAPVAEGQLVQTVFDQGGTLGAIGDRVLASSSFNIVKKIIEGTKALDLSVTKITINRSAEEVLVDTGAGARIIFSMRFDPEQTALPALVRFIKKPGLSNLSYVNLTVENRAFTKQK